MVSVNCRKIKRYSFDSHVENNNNNTGPLISSMTALTIRDDDLRDLFQFISRPLVFIFPATFSPRRENVDRGRGFI